MLLSTKIICVLTATAITYYLHRSADGASVRGFNWCSHYPDLHYSTQEGAVDSTHVTYMLDELLFVLRETDHIAERMRLNISSELHIHTDALEIITRTIQTALRLPPGGRITHDLPDTHAMPPTQYAPRMRDAIQTQAERLATVLLRQEIIDPRANLTVNSRFAVCVMQQVYGYLHGGGQFINVEGLRLGYTEVQMLRDYLDRDPTTRTMAQYALTVTYERVMRAIGADVLNLKNLVG